MHAWVFACIHLRLYVRIHDKVLFTFTKLSIYCKLIEFLHIYVNLWRLQVYACACAYACICVRSCRCCVLNRYEATFANFFIHLQLFRFAFLHYRIKCLILISVSVFLSWACFSFYCYWHQQMCIEIAYAGERITLFYFYYSQRSLLKKIYIFNQASGES